ncbi:MAG: Gfo/Idh/MocA family oxidoreductase [Rhodospirillaceae bacterium]
MYRAALIGLGHMGRHHLRVLNEHPEYELCAVVDPQVQQLPPAVTAPLLSDISQLDLDALDVIVIAAPTATHLTVMRSLERFKGHVLIEKPVCETVAEGIALSEIFDTSRLRVGHVERFNPVVVKLKEVLRAGHLGHVVHVSFTRVGGFPRSIQNSGSVIVDLAVHDIDLFNWAFGKPVLVGSAAHAHKPEKGHAPAVHTADILLKSTSGVTASVHCSWITPTKMRGIRITGTNGTCFVDLIAQTCTVHTGGITAASQLPAVDEITFGQFVAYSSVHDTIEFGIVRTEPLVAQLNGFAQFLRGEPSPCATYDEAMLALRVAEEAMKKGENLLDAAE